MPLTISPIRFLVLHHTASAPTITAADIHAMHNARGWSGAGYSYFIDIDGRVHVMRGLRRSLAANPPHNRDSIAVAVAGWNGNPDHPEWSWNSHQWESVAWFVDVVKVLVPDVIVGGHRDIGSTPTECPGLDVRVALGLVGGEV